jgi:hypothetical protein
MKVRGKLFFQWIERIMIVSSPGKKHEKAQRSQFWIQAEGEMDSVLHNTILHLGRHQMEVKRNSF